MCLRCLRKDISCQLPAAIVICQNSNLKFFDKISRQNFPHRTREWKTLFLSFSRRRLNIHKSCIENLKTLKCKLIEIPSDDCN